MSRLPTALRRYPDPTRAQDRHLVRAARVCCEAADAGLQGCAGDMIEAFGRLAEALRAD
jgi:hypothetical protein